MMATLTLNVVLVRELYNSMAAGYRIALLIISKFSPEGFSITLEDLYTKVLNYVNTASPSSWDDLGRTIGALKGTPDLRWANPLEVKNTVEKVFTEKFGDKSTAKAKAAVSHTVCPKLCFIDMEWYIGSETKERGRSLIELRSWSFNLCCADKISFRGGFPRQAPQAGRKSTDPSPSP